MNLIVTNKGIITNMYAKTTNHFKLDRVKKLEREADEFEVIQMVDFKLASLSKTYLTLVIILTNK